MIKVALKEWAVVCDLLLEGRLALLLRKGGILESGGPGVFELEHPRFALYPTWVHQNPEMIKPQHRQRIETSDEPETIVIRGIGQAARIWQVPDREAIERLDDLHCWTALQLDMRFNYKPDRPLYLLAVRACRLARPRSITNNPDYVGCRSWVHLREEDAIEETGATPVVDDEAFGKLVARIDDAMKQSD